MICAEMIKNEYREMIGGLKAAWSLIGHKLKYHGNKVFLSPYNYDDSRLDSF